MIYMEVPWFDGYQNSLKHQGPEKFISLIKSAKLLRTASIRWIGVL